MADYTISKENLFKEFGFKNAKSLEIRVKLTTEIIKLFRKMDTSQQKIADILGIHQTDVSQLLNGRSSYFSCDRLFTILDKLGQEIEITVKPKKK